MDNLLKILETSVPDEPDQSISLRKQTSQLLTSPDSTDPSNLPSTLHTLLTQIVKPLFSQSHHKSITSTGRKSQFPPPPLPNRFGTDSIFEPPPPWKSTWTTTLLTLILNTYNTIPEPTRKRTIEDHFHLLVPPLLHLIDDPEITYKCQGCHNLETLSNLLISVQSDILNRTGLAEVFIDALKGNFHYLPSLTPEDESLALLKSLYPAYLALVRARFITVETFISHPDKKTSPHPTYINSNNKSALIEEITVVNTTKPEPKPPPTPTPLTPSQISSSLSLRTTHLTHLLRHSLLHTLSHLSTSPNLSTTTSIPITTYLLSQLGPLLSALSITASVHLTCILPTLASTISDPFVPTASLEMMEAGVDAMVGVVEVCWVRVREKWWVECLRGLVGGWLNLRDEDEDVKEGKEERKKEVTRVMGKVRRAVMLLRDVVGDEEFEGVKERLCLEEMGLRGLFEGVEGSEKG